MTFNQSKVVFIHFVIPSCVAHNLVNVVDFKIINYVLVVQSFNNADTSSVTYLTCILLASCGKTMQQRCSNNYTVQSQK